MKTYAAHLLLFLLVLATPACGLLHLGSTNADGSPKTAADSLVIVRSFGDAALLTWGSDWLRQHAPGVIDAFDADRDGRLTLAEIEAHVDTSDQASLTNLLVLGIQLFEARKARKGAGLPG